jgi:hypothetical protein
MHTGGTDDRNTGLRTFKQTLLDSPKIGQNIGPMEDTG